MMWYDHPGKPTIGEALPIGNGRLGALVAGGVDEDRMTLCEDSVWSGGPFVYDNPAIREVIPAARRMLFEGKVAEAQQYIQKNYACLWGADIAEHFGNFQTLGYLDLKFPGTQPPAEGYRRELDLARGVATVTYQRGDFTFKRQIFASHPDQVVVVYLTASVPGQISVDVGLGRPDSPEVKAPASSGDKLTAPVDCRADADGAILMTGRLFNNREQNGMKIAAKCRVLNKGGRRDVDGKTVRVVDADSVMLVIAGATDYRGDDPIATVAKQVDAASPKSFEALVSSHVADFESLFDRVSLKLGEPKDDVPTDQRLQQLAQGTPDPDLAALYAQFGRYLMISSSRPGDLAANLQGLWAETIRTPWHGDYHTNINVQMNYWPAEPGNLAECVEPLVDLIERMVEPGTRTVQTCYGLRGWTVHTIHNVWGYTSPGYNPAWGAFPLAGPWMCQHLWEHYAFSGDEAFLRRAWPVMRGSGEFLLDWLVREPSSGKLVSGPTNSPENSFKLPDGTTASYTMGPAMDQEIAWDLLANLQDAARVLKIEDDFIRRVAAAREALKWPGIAKDGRLMEWPLDDVTERDPKHRHVSHLFGLHPGSQFNRLATPEYLDACRKSLEVRGDEGTGWSLAWKTNFWARLRDGDRAEKLVRQLLRPAGGTALNMSRGGGTYPNLFCAHPPMQIDGNFGGAAGIFEMLVQSHLRRDGNWVIDVLPALPSAWPTGHVTGLRVRGGAEVDISWSAGQLVAVRVRAKRAGTWSVEYAGTLRKVSLAADEAIVLRADLEPIEAFPLDGAKK
jgi:alpha-L-fucosidase 2